MTEGVRSKAGWRKRLAGLVLLLGALFLAHRFLVLSETQVPLRIHYVIDDDAEVDSLEADLVPRGQAEPLGRFTTRLLDPPIVQSRKVPPGAYDLHIRVQTAEGLVEAHRTVNVEPPRTETVVDLSREIP